MLNLNVTIEEALQGLGIYAPFMFEDSFVTLQQVNDKYRLDFHMDMETVPSSTWILEEWMVSGIMEQIPGWQVVEE